MKKVCTKCRIEKDLNEFNKEKRSKDSLRSWCKDCVKNYRDSHKEERKINDKKRIQKYQQNIRKNGYPVIKKTCTRCGLEKDLNEFNKCKASKDGLQYHCRNCDNRQSKRYDDSHKEEKKRYDKKYKDSHKKETKKATKKRIQKYQQDIEENGYPITKKVCTKCEIEKSLDSFYKSKYFKDGYVNRCKVCCKEYSDSHKEEKSKYDKKYSQTKKRRLSKSIGSSKRRALEKSTSDGTVTYEYCKMLLEKQDNRCIYCNKRFSKKVKRSLDHKIPFKRNGTHTAKNVHFVCINCNSSKGIKTHEEYLEILKKEK